MPHFEEIWPSGKSKDKYKRGHIPMNYYTDAMENGPQLSGMLTNTYVNTYNEKNVPMFQY